MANRLLWRRSICRKLLGGINAFWLSTANVIPFSLARIPTGSDFRGNLAAGGRGVVQPLSERDQWIAQQVAPTLKERGLIFVGLDVIGDYLTEINVTSPTCIREIDNAEDTQIGDQLIAAILGRLALATSEPS